VPWLRGGIHTHLVLQVARLGGRCRVERQGHAALRRDGCAALAATIHVVADDAPLHMVSLSLGRCEVKNPWVLLCLAVIAAACQPAPAVPTESIRATRPPSTPTTSGGEPSVECPAPTADTLLLDNAADGYCLLYPAEFGLYYPTAGEACIVPENPPLLWCANALVKIKAESASGRTAAQVADELLSTLHGLDIQRTTLAIGSEEAVVLDGIQGKDKQRKLFVVHADRLYTLTFARGRNFEEGGIYFERGKAIYALLVESMTFLEAD
jgi:hypothetical protein